jgi:hypothetical protein
MAASDATPFPAKNVAYRITFPILDADGDLVTGATGLDSEVSKDGGTFTDCTNEATEIATSSGVYYLDLTATEMNADTVAVIIKTSTSGAKTTTIIMNPTKGNDLNVVVGSYASGQTPLQPTVAGRTLDVSADGEAGIDLANVGSPTTTLNLSGTTISTSQQVASVSGAVGSVTNAVTVGTNNDKTGYSLATAPPTAAAIADAVWDETIGDHLTAGSTGAALNAAGSAGDPWTTTLPGSYTGSQAGKILADILVDTGTTLQAEVDDIQSRLPAALVSGRMDASVGAMAANVLTASALATDAVTEVAGGVWNALTASYVVNGSFGERVLRSTNTQAEVQVNGNGHVASVLHSSEANSITVGAFAADSITESALAASAATEIATATLTSAMTESYRSAGASPTLAQAAFELLAHMGDSSISGTTKTLKKLDGTTAKTFTLDSSTAPTSITEAT